MNAPEVGKTFERKPGEFIVPTYVRESEAPRENGACVTADYTRAPTFKPAGWYVEFRYPTSTETYRTFIPFADSATDRQGRKLGNVEAREGCDRCACGCKYWENDRCIDCGAHVREIPSETA